MTSVVADSCFVLRSDSIFNTSERRHTSHQTPYSLSVSGSAVGKAAFSLMVRCVSIYIYTDMAIGLVHQNASWGRGGGGFVGNTIPYGEDNSSSAVKS